MEICATSMHTIDIDTLHNEQKWDKMCKKLASQIHCSNKTVLIQLLCQKWYLTKAPIHSWFVA